jgi:hypothetical protein
MLSEDQINLLHQLSCTFRINVDALFSKALADIKSKINIGDEEKDSFNTGVAIDLANDLLRYVALTYIGEGVAGSEAVYELAQGFEDVGIGGGCCCDCCDEDEGEEIKSSPKPSLKLVN